MPLPKMSPRMFLELGMDVKGVAHQRSGRRRNVGRFIAWYGTEPYICSIVRDKLVISGYLHGHKGEPKHFLWALHFLKCYSTEANNAASVGGVDEKTFRKHAWFYAKGIASLVTSVVRWENRFRGDTGEKALITVDGTHCPIQEIYPFIKEINRKWYSHKFKGPGVGYEVGVCIKTGDIVWYFGPLPAGMNDLQVFKIKLKLALGPGEKVVADRGYRGDAKVIVGPEDWKSAIHRRAMRRALARQEDINRRLKRWGCLKQVFRHDRNKHHIVFEAVLTITQIEIEHGKVPFQVLNYSDPAFIDE